MKTFKYAWSAKIKSIAIGCIWLAMVNAVMSKGLNMDTFFLGCMILTLFLFLLFYGKVLFVRYSMTKEGLLISRLNAFKKTIYFEDIKRIIVREGEDSVFAKNTTMTIILNSGIKKRIIISALENADVFIQLLEQQPSFKTIQQDKKGNILKTA